jgi:valyl-tRNA synthetase
MNPGYEILFFWVARMILMSQFLLGEVPFKTVYLHGMLRDKSGKKFSKSLGTQIDLMEIIGKYGADALRMSLVVGIGPGNDANFDEQKVKAYKLFANKVWNIARFVQMSEKTEEVKKGLKKEFDELASDVTKDMDSYRFYLAAEKIYHYIWHRFADEILEESKGKPEYSGTLYYILENSLKLLHPFMPFLSEEIWQSLASNKEKSLLMIETWPA